MVRPLQGFAAAVAAAAAALNQLGYAQPQPQDPLAAALASLGLGNVDLQSLGQSLQGLSIPGLDLASIGLESLANPSPTPGVVSRRGKGYKGPPKGPPKGKGGGKARIQAGALELESFCWACLSARICRFSHRRKCRSGLVLQGFASSHLQQEPGVFVNAATQRDERKCRALLAHKDALELCLRTIPAWLLQ